MRPLARVALGIAFAFCIAPTHAQEGLLDTGFGGEGNGGKRRIMFNRGDTEATRRDYPSGIAVAPDGRIVVVGTVSTPSTVQTGFGVTRLTANGGPDITFNFIGGTPTLHFRALAGPSFVGGVAVMSDSRVLVVGGSDNIGIVMRFKADGTVDPVPGSPSAFFSVIAFQPPGRGTRFVDVAALPNGSILAAGWIALNAVDFKRDFIVARFLESGAIDPSFGNGGFTVVPFDLDDSMEDSAVAMAVAPSGRIVVVGTVAQTGNNIGVAALTPGGQLDPNFLGVLGTPGKTAFDWLNNSSDRAADVAIDSLGRILITATTNPSGMDVIGVARLQSNGLPDGSFGPSGRRTLVFFLEPLRAGSITTDAQNRVYVAGSADTSDILDAPRNVYVRRLLENGNADGSFGSSGIASYGHEPDDTGRDDIGVGIALQGDRPVIATAAQFSGADFDFGVARLTSATLFTDGFE